MRTDADWLDAPPARFLWAAWRHYTHRAARYQTAVLLSLVYLLVLGPSVLVARLFGQRLLDLGRQQRRTYWVQHQPAEKSVSAMERQF